MSDGPLEAGSKRVLVVDDERDLAESCAYFLRRAGYETDTVFSGEDALEQLQAGRYGLVITDVKMPRMSGLTLLEVAKERDPDLELVLITGFPEVSTAVEAMKRGALDYLTKPFNEQVLMERVEKAFAHKKLREENQNLNDRLKAGAKGRNLVHAESSMQDTVATVERAARTDASVLIQGESGTGKELLAHHLHDSSPRAGRPFVPVDCTTMPENLIESELFGHVKGAFSGATDNKMGLFQVADGGTLFLDELGEIPLAFQAKLLRAIQERQIRRVGGNDTVPVDVRIVCATNRNLVDEVAAGRFRQDLFYRLDVVRIEVPPLRDRPEDIATLGAHFLAEFRALNPVCTVSEVSADAMIVLKSCPWPGNVRQLKNAIERAATMGNSEVLQREDLPAELIAGTPEVHRQEFTGTFQEMKQLKVAAIESSYLTDVLKRHNGNVTRAAEAAGMTRSAFQKLMQRYGIKSSAFRSES